jgi:Cof subfamily protein (haloacid dehalogenase superfamily)
VQAFAADLDRTLIGEDGTLRPRTLGAIARARAAGIPLVVATGRMFRSVKPYLELAGVDAPTVCYQGGAVVDPRDGSFLLHEPISLPLARRAIAALQELGHPPNVYVRDQLYVAEHTPYSRAYAEFQHLPVTEVGDLLEWIDAGPTKLVAVGEPGELAVLRAALEERFGGLLHLTTSLPHLLELGNPSVSKGSGLTYVATRLGVDLDRVVAFGDGENDIELLAVAGFGVAVEESHPLLREHADWICPGPESEGVAAVIEAYLDGLDLPA